MIINFWDKRNVSKEKHVSSKDLSSNEELIIQLLFGTVKQE